MVPGHMLTVPVVKRHPDCGTGRGGAGQGEEERRGESVILFPFQRMCFLSKCNH